MADDYAPAILDDEDEELLKKTLYPPAEAPAQPAGMEPATPAPRTANYPAPDSAPAVPDTSMPPAMPVGASKGPNLNEDVMSGGVAAPTLATHKPTLRERIAAGMVAYQNPAAGIAQLNEPQRQNERQFAAESQQYNAAQQAGERNRNFQSEDALRKSEIVKNMRPPQTVGKTVPEETANDLMHGGPNGTPQINPATKQPWTWDEVNKHIVETAQSVKPPPKTTQEQNKEAFQAVVGKLQKEGLPTDPQHLPASFKKSKTLTPEERESAAGYMAANPTPATNIQVQVGGAEGKTGVANANKDFLYTDDNGTHLVKGSQLPEGAQSTPVKDVQALMSAAHTGNIVQASLDRIAQDVKAAPQVFDDPKLRAILATATEEGAARNMGILVAGTGGSITMPAGVNKIIDTWLENNAIQDPNTKKALQNYLVDYWSMKDKLYAMQMQMQGGKIGRAGASIFNAMLGQIPGGGTPSSYAAQRQIENLQGMHTELMSAFPDNYGNYQKAQPGGKAQPPVAGGGENTGKDLGAAPRGAKEGQTGKFNGVRAKIVNGRIISE